jgi:hypothetical protein
MTLAGNKSNFAIAAEKPYDPKKGWEEREQPIAGLTPQDYIELATHAAPGLSQSVRDFCDENGFSFVEIPHSVFADSYEKETVPFRTWLNDYCERNHLPKNAQIAIIGPRIKSLESAERKAEEKKPGKNADYLGIMMVVLKNGAPVKGHKDKKDLVPLTKAIEAIEKDTRSIARKNTYWEPHEITGFRDHKSIWEQVITSGEYKGFPIDAEIKIDHESHMDVDRQTRNQIIALSRKTGTWLSTLHASVAFDSNITGHSRRAKERSDFTTRVGIEIYNRVFADNGFNRLLNPELVHEYAPKSHEEILKMILNEGPKNSTTRGQVQHLLTGVVNSGVLPAPSKTPYGTPFQLPEHSVILH